MRLAKVSPKICALALLTLAATAHARSGRAAYHYRSSAMITAARYEPVGSVLKVTNPESGRSVTVRVAGRGPFNGNRILDMSTGAFSKLYGGLGRGVGPVSYELLSRGPATLAARNRRPTTGGRHRSGKRHKRQRRAQ